MKHLQIHQITINNNLLIPYNQDKYHSIKSLSNSNNLNNKYSSHNQHLKLLKVVISHQLQQTFSILVYQIQTPKS